MIPRQSGAEIYQVLLHLVETQDIGDQVSLLRGLRRQGITISQPKLSRHLRQPGILKLHGATW